MRPSFPCLDLAKPPAFRLQIARYALDIGTHPTGSAVRPGRGVAPRPVSADARVIARRGGSLEASAHVDAGPATPLFAQDPGEPASPPYHAVRRPSRALSRRSVPAAPV